MSCEKDAVIAGEAQVDNRVEIDIIFKDPGLEAPRIQETIESTIFQFTGLLWTVWTPVKSASYR